MRFLLLAACAVLASAEEPATPDPNQPPAADLSTAQRLAQLKKLAEFKKAQDAKKTAPPRLEDGDILVSGRYISSLAYFFLMRQAFFFPYSRGGCTLGMPASTAQCVHALDESASGSSATPPKKA